MIINVIITGGGWKSALGQDQQDAQDMDAPRLNALDKAVTRNFDRFPPDFMFQLTMEEFSTLKFHFGTSSWGEAHTLPEAFNKPPRRKRRTYREKR